MPDAVEQLRAQILSNPDFWRYFVPASFVHPKTLNPDYVIPDRSHLLSVCTIFNCVVASLVVGPRLYSRIFVVRRRFKLDDWLIIPAYISYMLCSMFTILALKRSALGKHIYDLTTQQILDWYFIQYSINITALTTIFITRLSILCFLWSLTANVEKKSRIAIGCVHVMNLFVWLTAMLPAVVFCSPEFRTWDLAALTVAKCVNQKRVDRDEKITLAMGVCGVLVDFAILAIPIRIVWKLKLPVKQRIVVSGLFAVGGFACIASVCKAYYIHIIIDYKNKYMMYDYSWTATNAYVSAQFEQCLALVTACGPGLKPVFTRAAAYLSDTFYGTSKFGFTSGPVPQPQPRPREAEAGAIVTIGGGGGKRGKRRRGLSELASTTSTTDDGVHNGNGEICTGDLESGLGAEGVPSAGKGEVEGLEKAEVEGLEKAEVEGLEKAEVEGPEKAEVEGLEKAEPVYAGV